MEATKALQGFSPAHFRWLTSAQFSTASPAQHSWEQLKNPHEFVGQMLSNVFHACFVSSPARARGGELCCSANVTTMVKVEVINPLGGAQTPFSSLLQHPSVLLMVMSTLRIPSSLFSCFYPVSAPTERVPTQSLPMGV